MVKLGDIFRAFVLRTLLILFVVGLAGEGLLARAGLSGRTACSFSDHSAMAMPMDHPAVTGSTTEREQAICATKCIAVAIFLPSSLVVLVSLEAAQLPRTYDPLLPAPVVSGPEGPPPKRLFV